MLWLIEWRKNPNFLPFQYTQPRSTSIILSSSALPFDPLSPPPPLLLLARYMRPSSSIRIWTKPRSSIWRPQFRVVHHYDNEKEATTAAAKPSAVAKPFAVEKLSAAEKPAPQYMWDFEIQWENRIFIF